MKIIKLKTNYRDKRGEIIDMVQKENINAVTIVTFNKGAVRGNHYHKKTIQYNYILKGKIKFVVVDKAGKKKSYVLKKGQFSLITAMEKHALKAVEKSELIVFTCGPRGGKEYETDTFRLDVPLIK